MPYGCVRIRMSSCCIMIFDPAASLERSALSEPIPIWHKELLSLSNTEPGYLVRLLLKDRQDLRPAINEFLLDRPLLKWSVSKDGYRRQTYHALQEEMDLQEGEESRF